MPLAEVIPVIARKAPQAAIPVGERERMATVTDFDIGFSHIGPTVGARFPDVVLPDRHGHTLPEHPSWVVTCQSCTEVNDAFCTVNGKHSLPHCWLARRRAGYGAPARIGH
jgi:hypothetical protein